jgi:hypothetical protein
LDIHSGQRLKTARGFTIATAVAFLLSQSVAGYAAAVPVYSEQKGKTAPAVSAPGTAISISPATQGVIPGGNFTVNVVITAPSPVRGGQVTFGFNQTLVSCLNVTAGTFFSNWAAANNATIYPYPLPVIDNVNGTVTEGGIAIAGGNTGGVTGSGTLFSYDFTARPGVHGNCSFTLSSVYVASATGEVIDNVTVSNGQVVIFELTTPVPSPTPTVTPTTPPSVTTGTTSGVTSTGATLNGNLTALGTAGNVNVSFEWGLTSTYGGMTTPVRQSATGAFSAILSGLGGNATYYYRAKATGDGLAYGDAGTFTTLPGVYPDWDINQDGRCDILDIVALGLHWGESGTPGWLRADVNKDGLVNIADVVIIGTHWTASSAPTPTPTPSPTPTPTPTPSPNASISLLPASKTVTPGASFNISAMLTTNTPTRGAQLALRFNPAVLRCESVTPGAFYSDWATAHGATVLNFPVPVWDNLAGTVSDFGVSLVGQDADGPTGTGIACTYRFIANATGTSPINITDAAIFVAVTDGTSAQLENVTINNASVTVSATTPTPAPPTVRTTSASSIASGTATVGGNLDIMGTAASVQVSFDYGQTTAYGSTTSAQTKTTVGAFSAALSGLTANTLYHYRAKALGDGNAAGSDMTFTTLSPSSTPTPVAPNVSTSDATLITSSGATLRGSLDYKGSAATVTVFFEYGTTTSYGSSSTAQSMSGNGAFNAVLTGLQPNTLYHFRAKATGADGAATGADRTFTTLAGGTAAPTISIMDAAELTYYSAILKCNLANLGSASAVKVSFEYGTTTSYGLSTYADTRSSPQEISSLRLEIFRPNTIYHFRAKAEGVGTVYTADRTFTTLPAPDASKSASILPATLTIAPGSSFTVNVTLTSNVAVRGAQVALSFSPSLLRCDNATEGKYFSDWATANGATTLVYPQPEINNTGGRISDFGVTILGSVPGGAMGMGTVFTYGFTAIGSGAGIIKFADIAVTDASGAMVHGVVENNVQVVISGDTSTPTPTPTSTLTPTVTPTSTLTPAVTPTTTPTKAATTPAASLTYMANSTVNGLPGNTTGIVTAEITKERLATLDLAANTDAAGRVTTHLVLENIGTIRKIEVLKDTVARTRDGAPVSGIEIYRADAPPPPTEANRIGLAYSFGPSGATFSQPIIITMEYYPETLPPGMTENDVVIAYYDEINREWLDIESTVDPLTHTISGKVSHFTLFAPLARIARPVAWWHIVAIIGVELGVGLLAFFIILKLIRRKNKISSNRHPPEEYGVYS